MDTLNILNTFIICGKCWPDITPYLCPAGHRTLTAGTPKKWFHAFCSDAISLKPLPHTIPSSCFILVPEPEQAVGWEADATGTGQIDFAELPLMSVLCMPHWHVFPEETSGVTGYWLPSWNNPKNNILPGPLNLTTSVQSNGNPAVQDGKRSFAGSWICSLVRVRKQGEALFNKIAAIA